MSNKDFEIVIKDGFIVDGSGNPWYKSDVGIKDGKIKKIGFINKDLADTIIPADGMVVSPGFVDSHNHSDLNILARPFCESNLMQGITTAVGGNCAWSMGPINKKYLNDLREYFSPFLLDDFDYEWDWQSLGEYYEKVEKKSIAINLAPLVGHGTLRIAVKGFSQEPLSSEEMNLMKDLLLKSLKEGAFGLSTGLAYPPGSYSDKRELIELGKVLQEYGGIYVSHMRNEGRDLVEAVEEVISIGKSNQIPVQISHHKAKGRSNWGKVHYTLKILEKERKNGLQVGCDVYPYTAGSTTITSILPTWALEGGVKEMLERLQNPEQREKMKRDFIEDNIKEGNDIKDAGFEGIFIASCLKKDYEGKSLLEISRIKGMGKEPFEAFFDLLLELKGKATVNKFITDEEDMKLVLTHPLSAVVTDSWATNPEANEKPHPRTYGAFPRVLGKYVREEKILRLQEAIRKMTSYPASIIGLQGRGFLVPGFWADIVIFNPETIIDRATYEDPNQYPEGIEYVFVNGKIAVKRHEISSKGYGQIIRSDFS